MKTHHILIASEQIWPNLLGLAYLLERDGGIQSLHIIHSDDEVRSVKPARCIGEISRKMFTGLIPCPHQALATSQAVVEQARLIMKTQGDDGVPWTVNGSGGTKLMFAGILPLSSLRAVDLFYRDVSQDWYQIVSRNNDYISKLLPQAEKTQVILPVMDLIGAQADIQKDGVWTQGEPVSSSDLHKWIKKGIEHCWNWSQLQKDFPALTQRGHGFVFEDLFTAIVTECGCRNMATNVKLRVKESTKQELDLVVSTGKEIVIFDLKLPEEPDSSATIDQIKKIADDARSLGGIGARGIAVRPNWLEGDGTTKALAQAHRVEVWTQEDMGGLVKKIVDLLHLPPPASDSPAGQVHQMLSAAALDGQRLFHSLQSYKTPLSNQSCEKRMGWLKLDGYRDQCQQMGLPLAVFELNGRYIIVGDKNALTLSPALIKAQKNKTADIQIVPSKKGVFAVIHPKKPEVLEEVKNWLSQQFAKRPAK